jgi:FkbH-like protein
VLGAMRGKARRVLVLDLDNTVWGGVVGDDGPERLVLGRGDPEGEAFLEVQRTALRLRERGVVLAVSSKNHDEVARTPFRTHPEMLLRESHIAVFQANWSDKASNLAAIAGTLSLGLDALVLLDDNPAERALVRGALPEVAVPELPDEPALYARTLLAAGYFEAAAFTQADRERAEQYTHNARRAELAAQFGDTDAFLRSLDMVARVAPFDAAGRARIAQLVGKTNQFNLTTRRYNEAQVAEFEADSAVWARQVRLEDRLGDNGMVAVVVCRRAHEAWTIDTWLMSCRVIGRRLEELTLDLVAAAARAGGARAIVGEFRPTGRNELVRDLYARLGFALVEEGPEGTRWRLDLDGYAPRRPPIALAEEVPA